MRAAHLNKMLMHFNSLLYTQLVNHRRLHTIHMELKFTKGYNAHLSSRVTNRQWRIFEQACLRRLSHLQGMRSVHLKGFKFVDPFNVFLAKQAMLRPSSGWWTLFSMIPKTMNGARQWWPPRKLSNYEFVPPRFMIVLIHSQGIHCNPSGRYVATTHNLGDVTFVAFQRPAWHSLTRGRPHIPQTNAARSYHASMHRHHSASVASLLQPPPIPPRLSFVKRRTLRFHQDLVKYWDRV